MDAASTPVMTREQALALLQRDRWAAVNALVDDEARRAGPDERFRDLEMLVASGSFFSRGHSVAERPPERPTELRPERPPEALTPALESVLAWLEACGLEFTVVGGVAVGLLGRPRYTKDLDVLVAVNEAGVAEVLTRAEAFGLRARVPDALSVALRQRVLLLRHEPTNMPVDVMLASVPLDFDVIRGAERRPHGGLPIPLPRVQDLIAMKVLAHRPMDLGDVDTLVALNPTADLSDALRIVREVAESASMPDLIAAFERIVRARRGAP